METIIYWIGQVVGFFLLIYLVIYILYLWLDLNLNALLSVEAMPALKPVPIPTNNQKTVLHKLAVFVFEVRKWEVVENWHYKLDDDVELIIPKGFRFDGASIPRPFWAVLNPIGVLLIPGLLHDYGYKYQQIWQLNAQGDVVPYQEGAKKEFWDNLFKNVGRDVNGFFLINGIAWLAVALGGSAAWEDHRKRDLKAPKPEL